MYRNKYKGVTTMKIEFLCKNYTASDKLKDIISRKVDKLDKFFDEDEKAKVVLKSRRTSLPSKLRSPFRAESYEPKSSATICTTT